MPKTCFGLAVLTLFLVVIPMPNDHLPDNEDEEQPNHTIDSPFSRKMRLMGEHIPCAKMFNRLLNSLIQAQSEELPTRIRRA